MGSLEINLGKRNCSIYIRTYAHIKMHINILNSVTRIWKKEILVNIWGSQIEENKVKKNIALFILSV